MQQRQHDQDTTAVEFVRAVQARDKRVVERPLVREVSREREVHTILSVEKLRVEHTANDERF